VTSRQTDARTCSSTQTDRQRRKQKLRDGRTDKQADARTDSPLGSDANARQMILKIVLAFLQRCMECRRGLVMRILSVRTSVKRVICDKTKRMMCPDFIPYERSLSLVFWEGEWSVGGDPFYLKFWVNRPPSERSRRFSVVAHQRAIRVTTQKHATPAGSLQFPR